MMDDEMKKMWSEMDGTPYDSMAGILRPRIHSDVPSFIDVPVAYEASDLEGLDVGFIGLPFEGWIHPAPMQWPTSGARPADPDVLEGRSGAWDAPDYIRKCAVHYSICTSGGFCPEVAGDFRICDHITMADYRNVEFDPWDVEDFSKKAIEKVADIVKGGAIPLIFGGDHSISYPPVRAISDNSDGEIGIILFDGHYDNMYGGDAPFPEKNAVTRLNSGNQFYKIFDTCKAHPKNMVVIGVKGGAANMMSWHEMAVKLGYTIFTNEDVEDLGIKEVMRQAIAVATKDTDKVYCSLDVDACDPISFPAQKYPDPFGIPARDIRTALRILSRETNLCGFDMVCLGPAYDNRNDGGQTAAKLYIEILKGLAYRKAYGITTHGPE
ncbi:MAG: hypothetical protein DRR06_15400 [Gammaproteobacteria bacterium]|nr:MAG: hypothetical protein DRR06_15400 [Gammaproteobacteria bacterium]